jgi:hypothetical protein
MAITGNGSGGLPLNATLGISVSGMTDATSQSYRDVLIQGCI